MSIDQVDQNSRGEITRPPNPLKEGDFKRTRRLTDTIEGRQPLRGIGVKVISSNTVNIHIQILKATQALSH